MTNYPYEQIHTLLTAVNANIPQLLIVSPDSFEIMGAHVEAPASAVQFEDVAILVEKAEGETCDRCRQVKKDVGTDTKLPTLCAHCAQIVTKEYPEAVAEGFEA